MSKHWNPDHELARWKGADGTTRPAKPHWPEGATVGLLAVAASCLAIGLVLYHAAGPRIVIEESVRR